MFTIEIASPEIGNVKFDLPANIGTEIMLRLSKEEQQIIREKIAQQLQLLCATQCGALSAGALGIFILEGIDAALEEQAKLAASLLG